MQMPTTVVIFEANNSWSGELVETKGGAQSVGGSSRRKHRPSQGDQDFDEDHRDDDDRREVNLMINLDLKHKMSVNYSDDYHI